MGDTKGKDYLVLSLVAVVIIIIGFSLTFQLSGLNFPFTAYYQAGVSIIFLWMPFLFYFACGFWSANRNITKQKEKMQLDPANFGFWESFISVLGKDGETLQYWMRCILFGLIMYSAAGIAAVLSDTLLPATTNADKGFLIDAYPPVLAIVTGFTALFGIRALRGLGSKLLDAQRHLNVSMNSGKGVKDLDAKFGKCDEWKLRKWNLKKWKSEEWKLKKWTVGYWASVISFAFIGGLVGYLTANAPQNSGNWIGRGYPISSLAVIIECVVIGFTVGALVFVSARGIAILYRFCQHCIMAKSGSCSDSCSERPSVCVNIGYNPDRFCGLGQISQFSFELDLAAAVPSFAFFVAYLSGARLFSSESLICLSIYTFILIVIFLLPLRPFHAKMAIAKEHALADINRRFSEAYSEILDKGADPKSLRKLKDIYFLQERIAIKPVWPFKHWVDWKVLTTIPLPLVLSIISNYLSELLLGAAR